MLRRFVKCIPNTITCLNLVCGCLAVFASFHQIEPLVGGINGLGWAYILIGLAALFDFCDGLAARLLHAYSDLGKQLDSLCDLISFGVAPGMIVLNLMLQFSQYPALAFAALLIPVAGALRLAKFNIDDTQTTSFRGLPIPANAIFWIGLTAWVRQFSYPGTSVMVIIIVLLSLAMVSRMRMFSLKFKNFDWRENFRRYVLIAGAVLFVSTCGISGLAWTIVLYLILSLVTRNKE